MTGPHKRSAGARRSRTHPHMRLVRVWRALVVCCSVWAGVRVRFRLLQLRFVSCSPAVTLHTPARLRTERPPIAIARQGVPAAAKEFYKMLDLVHDEEDAHVKWKCSEHQD